MKLRKIFLLPAIWLLLFTPKIPGSAQIARRSLREGNRLLKTEQYSESEEAFRRSLDKERNNPKAWFGLGNALYNQEKYDKASEAYTKTLDLSEGILTSEQVADIYHNLGNTQLKQKNYADAVKSYFESLVLNPNDETRYNYVLAKNLLKKEQQNNPQSRQAPQQNQSQTSSQNNQKSPEKSPNNRHLDKKTSEQILDSFRQDDDETRRRVDQRKRNQEAKPEDPNKKRW